MFDVVEYIQLRSASLTGWQWSAVLVAALVAAIIDCRTMRIPNLVSGLTLISGLIWSIVQGGWGGLGSAVAGLLIAAAPFVLLYALGGGGAGDAKLMAGLGAWLGLHAAVVMLLCVMIAGGALAVIWASRRRALGRAWWNVFWVLMQLKSWLLGRHDGGVVALPGREALHLMPYGLAIFAGNCLAWGVWICQ